MLESIILGTIQGIAEWLPVSSEGMIFLVKSNFFYNGESIKEIAGLALFLHFGTFLAALVYFRKDVWVLFKELKMLLPKAVRPLSERSDRSNANKKVLVFLIISTLISGVLGYGLLIWVNSLGAENNVEVFTKYINLIIGVLLLITAYLLIKAKRGGERTDESLKISDGVILGLTQTFASLPGLSRSGLTVSALLLRKFNSESAIKLSFLMSLPIVLAGNIVLNLGEFSLSINSFLALLFSFAFGFLTINILLKVAKKINFGYFVLVFGVLMILVSFL
jgi:undecaprenyl-diphosphatase